MQVDSGVLIGGRYVVERLVGRGGMGAVWAARHMRLGHAVAIKVLDGRLVRTPGMLARFEQEARAVARLETVHVVQMHDYGVQEGTPFLVMELLRGVDLSTRLRERGRLSLADAAATLVQAGRGLRCAHHAGIVHRDLKPANLFLSQSDIDGDEVLKILDFGVAKDSSLSGILLTRPGEIIGSPHYMSPEQAAGEVVDHRTDLWAMGVILYRLLTGRLPFSGDVLVNVLGAVIRLPFPPLVEVAPGLPSELDPFFARALAKRKEERFSSISEMVESFTGLLEEGSRRGFHGQDGGTQPLLSRRLPKKESVGTARGAPALSADEGESLAPMGPGSASVDRMASAGSPADAAAQPVTRSTNRARRSPWPMFGGLGLCLGIASQGWLLTRRPAEATRSQSAASAHPSPSTSDAGEGPSASSRPDSTPQPDSPPPALPSVTTATPAVVARAPVSTSEDVYGTLDKAPTTKTLSPRSSASPAPAASSSSDTTTGTVDSLPRYPREQDDAPPTLSIPEYGGAESPKEKQR